MRLEKRIVFILAALVVSILPAQGDIGPSTSAPAGATNASPPKDVPVEMLWEEVDLYPSPEKNKVVAVFGLKNTGDREVKFEVGFPSYNRMSLQDFEVEIDGKKESAKMKKEREEGTGSVGAKESASFIYWMTWEMNFHKGQERKVKVSYWVETEGDPYLQKIPEDLKAKIGEYKSGYVLRTGAGWAGKIGKAVIRLHYSDPLKKTKQTTLKPEKGWQYDSENNTDTLILEDFEPDSSYDVEYAFDLSDDAQQGKVLLEALKARRLDPWALFRLLTLLERNDNPLSLPESEKKALVIETMEWMVPPTGPALDTTEMSRLAGGVWTFLDIYRRLFAHYKQENNREKGVALAKHYQKHLKPLLDASRGNSEYQKLQDEYDEITTYIAKNSSGK